MILKSSLPELEIPNKTFHDFLFDEWRKFGDDLALVSSMLRCSSFRLSD